METPFYMSSYMFFIIFAVLSLLQIKMLNRSSSDHQGHIFIINETKAKWSLPKYPRSIVNKSSWGGYPILLHYIIGKLPKSIAAFFQNYIGVVFSLLTPLCVLFFFDSFENNLIVFLLLFAPYNFDITNAKNYGFSTRSIGQFFFVLFLCLFLENQHLGSLQNSYSLFFMVISVFFLISFNVFALQCMIFLSIVSCFFGVFLPVVVLFLASILFVIIFPGYGFSYLKSTFKYWNIYRTHLAKSSILIDYQSFWITPLKKGFNLLLERNFQGLYNLIFKNSLFMGFILNPIPWVAFAIFYTYEVEQNYLIIFSSMMIAFFITSFRFGRFWGESNRYLEMIAPFAVIYTFPFIEDLMPILMAYFSLFVIFQFLISYKLSKKLGLSENNFGAFEREINSFGLKNILLFSNNHHASKYFLTNPWNFILIWSFEEEIVGVKSPEVFSRFPKIKFEYFLKILDSYKPNFIILEDLGDVNSKELISRGYKNIKKIESFSLFTNT